MTYNERMKKWFAIIVLSVAQFVMVLDGTVMNVSISTVATDLGTTITGMQTAITVFTLTMAAFMLTGGKLGDILGRRKAFKIGAGIYGIGSLVTALAPTLEVLFFGWSIVEGLGAVLVIPAIAALAAANYTGKSRVVAFSLLGAATGLAAAVGPIIGGFVTTYFSWRYVFLSETIIMIFVLLVAGKIKDSKVTEKVKLDILSVILSASGMAIFVLGVLQSRSWGWIRPLGAPEFNGNEITPLGISMVAYLIIIGLFILKLFYDRQLALATVGKQPLLNVAVLKLPVLRSGLSLLAAQYFTIASVFFIIPVYLQTILGYDALQTGIKLLPLSLGMLIFTLVGTKKTGSFSTKRIVRFGQVAMTIGVVLVLSSIGVELESRLFWLGMFFVGVGFGLLASQLGNVNISSVEEPQAAEVGGLQGVFQNLGLSLGTALVGSVFVLSLSSGFSSAVQANPDLSSEAKYSISLRTQDGVGIVSKAQAEQYVLDNGGSMNAAQTISSLYEDSQLDSLRVGMLFVFACLLGSFALSKQLPATLQKSKK